jgi:hypothetical protein
VHCFEDVMLQYGIILWELCYGVFYGMRLNIDIYKDKSLWFSPARVSKLNSMYCDLSLHAFTILKLMND